MRDDDRKDHNDRHWPGAGGRRWRAAGAAAAWAVALAVGGCAGGPSIAVQTVLNYDQCQGIEAGLTQVDIGDVAGIRGSTLLRMSEPERATGTGGDGTDEPLLIAISRGHQPTPGYRLTLEGAERRDTTALIRVTWESPASGAVLPQVMTHPCLVVSLDAGPWQQVEAVDQSGRKVGSLTLTGVSR